ETRTCTITAIIDGVSSRYAIAVPFNGGAKLTISGDNVNAVTVSGIDSRFYSQPNNKTITFNNITEDVNCTIETNITKNTQTVVIGGGDGGYSGGGSSGGSSGGGGGAAGGASKTAALVEDVWTDVDNQRYYYDAMQWAYDEGIMEPKKDNTFGIGDQVSRAEFFQALYKAVGEPSVGSNAQTPFKDVSNTSDYYDAVVWAVTNGLTNGAGANDVFAPSMKLDRAQIVTILWRYAGSRIQNGKIDFTDVRKDSYYEDAVDWATANGIINGTGDGTTFSPLDYMLKESSITMLYRKFVKALF
ncbi:MAG: S-layer homology domain-containing protein, partial [Bacillota bacterium]|nr:S-layer homology domain-containing protein [Bacillota bacterium]